MVLIMAQVYPDIICLVGRWRSITMLRYLHTTAKSFTEGLSVKLFEHVVYTLLPSSHAGNYCQAALKRPQGPFYKRVL